MVQRIACTDQCHVADAAQREVVVVGSIATRRARKHYVVTAGEVGVHNCRYTLGAIVMLQMHIPHSLTVHTGRYSHNGLATSLSVVSPRSMLASCILANVLHYRVRQNKVAP